MLRDFPGIQNAVCVLSDLIPALSDPENLPAPTLRVDMIGAVIYLRR